MNIAANSHKPKQDKTFLRSCEPCRTAKAKCVPVADPNVKECERSADTPQYPARLPQLFTMMPQMPEIPQELRICRSAAAP